MSEDWKTSGKVTTIYDGIEHNDGSLPLDESNFVYVSEWQAVGDNKSEFVDYTNYMPISYALSQSETGIDGKLYFNIIGYHNLYGSDEILTSPIKLINANDSIGFEYGDSDLLICSNGQYMLADGVPTLWGDYNFSNEAILIGKGQSVKEYNQKNVEIKGDYTTWNDDITIDYWHDSEHITYDSMGADSVVGTVKVGNAEKLTAELKNIADIDNTNSMLMPQIRVEGAPIYNQIVGMGITLRLLLDDKLQPKGKDKATCIKAWISRSTGGNS